VSEGEGERVRLCGGDVVYTKRRMGHQLTQRDSDGRDDVFFSTAELEAIPHVAAIIAERDALRKRVQELEESNKPQGWTYSSLTNAYLGIPEGIGPSARTSMTQPLPPSEEISDG